MSALVSVLVHESLDGVRMSISVFLVRHFCDVHLHVHACIMRFCWMSKSNLQHMHTHTNKYEYQHMHTHTHKYEYHARTTVSHALLIAARDRVEGDRERFRENNFEEEIWR